MIMDITLKRPRATTSYNDLLVFEDKCHLRTALKASTRRRQRNSRFLRHSVRCKTYTVLSCTLLASAHCPLTSALYRLPVAWIRSIEAPYHRMSPPAQQKPEQVHFRREKKTPIEKLGFSKYQRLFHQPPRPPGKVDDNAYETFQINKYQTCAPGTISHVSKRFMGLKW